MTAREWQSKRVEAYKEYLAEIEAGTTTLNFEAWRITKNYIVTGAPS